MKCGFDLSCWVDDAWQAVVNKLLLLWAPIVEWLFVIEIFAIVIAGILAVFAICFFLPFKWIKVVGGWLVSLGIAFLAGFIFMFKHERAVQALRKAEALKQKIRAEQQKPAKPPNQGWF